MLERRGSLSLPPVGPALLDACASDPAGGECERVDKVMFRSGAGIELTPLAYGIRPEFFDAHCVPLSDHDAVNVVFSWSLVPEPDSAALLGAGLAALALRSRSRGRRRA